MRAILKAFRKLGEVLGKNRTLRNAITYGVAGAIALAFVLGVAGAMGGARSADDQGRASEAAAVEDQAGTEAPEEGKGGGATAPAADYTGADKEAVTTLASYSWTDGNVVVTFGDGTATVSRPGSDDATREYRVSRTRDGGSKTSEFTDGTTSSATSRQLTFILGLDGEDYPATLTTVTRDDGSFQAGLACEGLSESTLASAAASSTLTLSEDSAGLAGYVGGSLSGLQDALRTWASKSAPSATTATWDGVVTIDTTGGTVTFKLGIDGVSATRASVTYSTQDGSFDVSATR